ncbi:Hypothetical predicted protein [Cloeon dipterum]|uniref:Uncharacterized protein n=1 Tax=Cloeon dipterum TaxID=197152 RepID=A0A8S1CDY7_9INSE|nr:Hypothetical predicted protein [Cloeon dipterum]
MKILKWLLSLAILCGSTFAQQNLFFPGSTNTQAQNSPSIQSISSRIANRLKANNNKRNEERRTFEVPKPGDVTTTSTMPPEYANSRSYDQNPQFQFSTPPPFVNNNFFSNNRPSFFSSGSRPGFFGSSPFGLNDFNFQAATFPTFNQRPDSNIFDSGANQGAGQPKNYHFRRDYNDKDGYSPWRDVTGSNSPQGDFQQSTGTRQISFPSPNFHQKFDLGPQGFFNFGKQADEKKNGSNGYSDKTVAIMKIEPAEKHHKNLGDFARGNSQNTFGDSADNDFNLNNLAQSFRSIKWPGQN